MKQNILTHPNPTNDKVAVFTALHAFLAKVTNVLPTWKRRLKQHNALTELSSHLLADVSNFRGPVIRRDQQTFLENLAMLKFEQLEIENSDDDVYHIQEAGNTEFVTGNRDSLSENFNAEIDAWAKHALASNGFGDYQESANKPRGG